MKNEWLFEWLLWLQHNGMINDQNINYLQMWEMANAFQFPTELRNDHNVTKT